MNQLPPGKSIEELLARWREESGILERLAQAEEAASSPKEAPAAQAPASGVHLPPPLALQPENIPSAGNFALHDLARFHDERFITACFQAILNRPPDTEGFHYYLGSLREGRLSKTEIVARLRYSKEGRRLKKKIHGLTIRIPLLAVLRIPVLGQLAAWVTAFLRPGKVKSDLDRFQAYGMSLFTRVETHHNALLEEVRRIADENSAAEIRRRLAEIERGAEAVSRLTGMLGENREAIVTLQKGMEERIQSLNESLSRDLEGARETIERVRREHVETLERDRDDFSQAVEVLAARLKDERTRSGNRLDALKRDLAAEKELIAASVETLGARLNDGEQAMKALSRTAATREELAKTVDGVKAALLKELNGITSDVRRLEQDWTQREADVIRDLKDNLERQRSGVYADLQRVEAEWRDKGLAAISALQEEVALQRKALEGPALTEEFYESHQAVFRGDFEGVRKRLSIYLPYIEESGAGVPGRPVLDIGCGRGEWLSLLRENSLECSGMDASESAVLRCRELGVDCERGKAPASLASLPSNAFGAVTAFHLIEHLALSQQIEFLEQIRRILAKDGLMILETPNPSNLIVGASAFYLDPTHVRPLPSALAEFLARQAGFSKVSILEVNPFPEEEHLKGSASGSRLDSLLFGPRDYALIGSKSGGGTGRNT
ncbi:MAG: methyltransferase domain-containing protein [Acidobacteriota bacterium]